MDRLTRILQICSIFDNIPQEKYPNVLHCLQGKQKTFKRDETILNIGEVQQIAGIVLSGIIELSFFDENGNQASVKHIKLGDVFGAERACCDWPAATIQLRAVTDCQVLFLNFRNLLQVQSNCCPYRTQVTVNLLRDFARQTQFLNLKLQIMAQKHLRNKLKIYLRSLHIQPDGTIILPFNRRELAEFLSVDRSALSRELCRMRDEEILRFKDNQLQMLDRRFLAT